MVLFLCTRRIMGAVRTFFQDCGESITEPTETNILTHIHTHSQQWTYSEPPPDVWAPHSPHLSSLERTLKATKTRASTRKDCFNRVLQRQDWKNPAREPIVACFCAKTNIWQIKTEEQSAAKSPKRCKDLGCRCLGNMFGLERELKVCETRLVFILLCVSTEWLAEPGWKLVGLFFRLLPKVHDRIGEGWTVDQVVQLYQSWTSHYLDHS